MAKDKDFVEFKDWDAPRLKNIYDRVKALGWDFYTWPGTFNIGKKAEKGGWSILYFTGDPDNEADLSNAEALLSRCEFGPTIKIKLETDGYCSQECGLWAGKLYGDAGSTFSPEPYAIDKGCLVGWSQQFHRAGPLCPGPAPEGKEWTLTLKEKHDESTS